MPLPDRGLPVLALCVLAMTIAGCSKGPSLKSDSYKLEDTRVYDVRDSPEVRREMAFRNYMVIAGQRMREGDLDAAIEQARRAQKQVPQAADSYTLLGMIHNARGESAKTGEFYRQATERAPADPGVLGNYGAWLCGQGRYAESLTWFDRALALPAGPARAGLLANSGGCAVDAGVTVRAERDLRMALELDPANAFALESMARNAFASERFMEARAFVQRRLAAAPATGSVLQLASQIELRLGDNAASSRYLQRIREEFPQNASDDHRG